MSEQVTVKDDGREATVWRYSSKGDTSRRYAGIMIGYLVAILALMAALIGGSVLIAVYRLSDTDLGRWLVTALVLLVTIVMCGGGVVVGQRGASMMRCFVKLPDGRIYVLDLGHMSPFTINGTTRVSPSRSGTRGSLGILASNHAMLRYADEQHFVKSLVAQGRTVNYGNRIAQVTSIRGGIFSYAIRCQLRVVGDETSEFSSRLIVSKSYEDADGLIAELRSHMTAQVFTRG